MDEDLRNWGHEQLPCKAGYLPSKNCPKAGIPVNVMFAPIIPGLNDHEVFKVAEWTSKLGGKRYGLYHGSLEWGCGINLRNWIKKVFPDRADKVLNKIKDCHGGQLEDHRFGRMRAKEILRNNPQPVSFG
ncbi:MAG: hypothetical protein R2788_14470 [Saprospiraceae bacterium]